MFEGVGELGGQAAEDRRLTYAWHPRYMLNYNSAIQVSVWQLSPLPLSDFIYISTITIIYTYTLILMYISNLEIPCWYSASIDHHLHFFCSICSCIILPCCGFYCTCEWFKYYIFNWYFESFESYCTFSDHCLTRYVWGVCSYIILL